MAHLAPRDIAAVIVGLGALFSWTLGLLMGFILGRKIKMTKKEAARVMSKASWRNRAVTCTRPRSHYGPCNGSPRKTCKQVLDR